MSVDAKASNQKAPEPPHLILYNLVHGGFSLNKTIKDLYKKRTGNEADDSLDRWDDKRFDYNLRNNQELCKIVQELGLKRTEGVDVASIDAKFKNCYTLHEYDGAESIHINYEKYRVDQIKEYLNNPALQGKVFDDLRELANQPLDAKLDAKYLWQPRLY